MDEQLIDRIYECSFSPDFWPGVLDELAKIADARGGHLFAASTKVLSWTSSAIFREGMEWFAKRDLVTRGQRCDRLCGARHAGFLRDHDLYANGEEKGADPFYSEMLWPAGLGWAAGTAIPLPTGATAFLTVERNLDRGPVEWAVVHQLDLLRPHLARSALMSARLQMERARIASETLTLIGLPALVFDERGKVLAANALIEAETDHISWRAHDRVSLRDANANALFRLATDTLNISDASKTRSFAVRGAEANAAMVAHVIPIRRSARDIFVRCAGVLVLTPVTLPQAPPVELVQSLFDLTPAEARVARRLTGGESVADIASTGGISLNTVRTQVRGVLEKTGCRRQAEVIALLGGISVSHG
jgi:DNA-binding CsgD family transcriptional regulator